MIKRYVFRLCSVIHTYINLSRLYLLFLEYISPLFSGCTNGKVNIKLTLYGDYFFLLMSTLICVHSIFTIMIDGNLVLYIFKVGRRS